MASTATARKVRERVTEAFEQSAFSSFAEASRAADQAHNFVAKIVSGHFDHSKGGPGVFAVKRLADALGVSVGYLIGEDITPDPQRQAFFAGTDRPKSASERLMEMHWRGDGRLEAFQALIEDCDIYAPPSPDATTPTIKRIGKRTLFAGRLGGPLTRLAQQEINAFSEEVRQGILRFHRRVMAEGTAIENTFLSHRMITRPVRIAAGNSRLGLLVQNHQGEPAILVHATPIPA